RHAALSFHKGANRLPVRRRFRESAVAARLHERDVRLSHRLRAPGGTRPRPRLRRWDSGADSDVQLGGPRNPFWATSANAQAKEIMLAKLFVPCSGSRSKLPRIIVPRAPAKDP